MIVRDQAEADAKERVLKAVDQVATRVRRSLGESLVSIEKYRRADRAGDHEVARGAQGVHARHRRARERREIESIPFFQRAIDLDPNFALAYTILSTVYRTLGESRQGEEFARLAYERRQQVTERERLFIEYQYHDRFTGDQTKAAEILTVWKTTFPRDASPANSLAVLYNRLGLYERGAEEAREAIRRNPSHPFPHSNLANAYRGLNRFADARKTAEEAIRRNVATLPLHRLVYQLALLEGDMQAAEAQLTWARGNAREFDFVGARAQVASHYGRVIEARELYRQTTEMARGRNFAEVASGYATQAAWMEALVGNAAEAKAMAQVVIREGATPVLRLRAAAALGLAGAWREAEDLLGATPVGKSDTLMNGVYVPAGPGHGGAGPRRCGRCGRGARASGAL